MRCTNISFLFKFKVIKYLLAILQVFNIATDLLSWMEGLNPSKESPPLTRAVDSGIEKLKMYVHGKQPAMPFFEACRVLDPAQLSLLPNNIDTFVQGIPELSKCRDEWTTYLEIAKSANLPETPRLFWLATRTRLPILSKVALGLLQVPARSVDVERSFSKVGMLLTPQRRRMTEENLEKLTFLYVNANNID